MARRKKTSRQTDKNEAVTNDFGIDQFALDQEWMAQPRLYMRYASELADVTREWDDAKVALEVVKAELAKAIRDDPSGYGMEKVTESAIAAAVVLQSEYQEAVSNVNAAKHAKEMLAASVIALDHKKKALEKLVDLHLSNYFAEPRAPQGKDEEVDQMKKRSVRKPLKKRG